MNVLVERILHAPLTVAVVALFAILLLAGIASPLTEWTEDAFRDVSNSASSSGSASNSLNASAVDSPRAHGIREKARCDHCAIVVSTNRLAAAGDAPPMYEITVRLADRTTRVFQDSNAPRWRPGERIVLIEGGNSPRN